MTKFLKYLGISIFISVILIALIIFVFQKITFWEIEKKLTPEQKEKMRLAKTEKILLKIVPEAESGAGSSDNNSENKQAGTDSSNTPGIRTLILTSDPTKFVPFSKETEKFAAEFSSQINKDLMQVIENAWNYYKDGRTSDTLNAYADIKNKMTELEPAIPSYIKAVNQADYNVEIWGCDLINDQMIFLAPYAPAFVRWGNLLLEIKIHELIKEKKYAEAFEYAEAMIKASHPAKYTNNTEFFNIKDTYVNACNVYYQIISACDSPNVLAAALTKQKEMVSAADFPVSMLPPEYLKVFGTLRAGDRYGIRSEINGMTFTQILAEEAKVNETYARQISSSNNGSHDSKIKKIQTDTYRTIHVVMGGKPKTPKEFLLKVFSPAIKDIFLVGEIARDSDFAYWGFRYPEKYTNEYYNLLILETALRLYELRNGKKPDSIDNLAGEYLAEIPEDFFSENKPGWKYVNGKIYSVGPDNTDQEYKEKFFPGRGEKSSGDIFFEKNKVEKLGIQK